MKIRRILGGLLLALWTAFAFADGALVNLPRQLVVDAEGEVRVGAKLYVYAAGSTTPISVYTTSSLAVAQSNPVVSVSSGLFPAIYLDPADGNYKLVLKDSDDVTLYTEDNIPAGGSTVFPVTADETAAGATPVDFNYPVGHSKRYGATCDGVADDTAEIQAAINVASEVGGTAVIQDGTCLVDTLTLDASNFTISGEGRGSILKASSDIAADCAILVSLAGGADETANQALLDTACPGIDVRTNAAGSLENVHIENLRFQSNTAAIRAIWATGFTRGCIIEGNAFENFDGAGVALNGSWSFTIRTNHFSGDGTNGVGIQLGVTGNGERSSSKDVNAANIIGNEITAQSKGLEWDFGAGGQVVGNIIEFNAGDGFESQSVEGLAVTGNYFETNGDDNLDMGGTNGTDFAEGWQVVGNRFTQNNSDTNIRMDGVKNSFLGFNDFSGSVTQHYFIPSSGGANVLENYIWVPDDTSTYIANASELDFTDNFVVKTDSSEYRNNVPRLTVFTEFKHATSATLGFYGTTPTTQQADISALTDSTTGSANNTVTDVGGSFNQATLNNNFADLIDQINLLRSLLRAYGLMQ